MSWTEKKRVKLLEEIADMAMKHGIHVFYKRETDYATASGYRQQLYINWPDDATTVAQRHVEATKCITGLSQKTYGQVKAAYKFARTTVAGLDVGMTLKNRIDMEALDAVRNEAMIKLYQAGRDDDPAFALLAGATTLDQVVGISREIEKKELAGRNRNR